MKNRITTLVAALMLVSFVSFANDGVLPSDKLQKELSSEFANATNIKWEKVADYYKASFIQDGQYMVAYFNSFNELESLSRTLTTNMLPLTLQKDLKSKVSADSWISDCFEVSAQSGTAYFVVVENEDQKTIYQADEFGWSVFKRTNK